MPRLVVHVVHRFDTGGMENGMVNLFNAMSPERFRHVVIALTDYSDFRLRITGQTVDFIGLNRQPGHDYAWVPTLWKHLRRLKPDLVHTRNLSALEAQFVAAAAGVRATLHGEHGRDVFDLHGQNRKYNVLRRLAQPLVSNYIAVSRDLAGWLRDTVKVPPRKIHQIHNGVDSMKFHPRQIDDSLAATPAGLPPEWPTDRFIIASVGRMAEIKDYPTLVSAFIRLVQSHPEIRARVRLIIVGDGVARKPCLALLADAGMIDLAWLPGERNDIAEIMRICDVFVLPSRNEGISNTLLEAMASGLPVVATAVGGNVELVEQEFNGTLVASGDSEAMAHALLGYVQSPARVAAQGRQARLSVETRYSIPAMAEAYAAVYEQTLAGRQTA
ncbi:MAG: TIGR03088 family PEP-CTERM/XrtA system glycosyltransferase [Thiobacillus sp.]